MSTASFSSTIPGRNTNTFANEVSSRYGAIPNGHTRVLCPCDAGARMPSTPVFPQSARPYARMNDINADGPNWRNVLGTSRHIAVWDIPTSVWNRRGQVALAWSDYFRGTITSLRQETAPPEVVPMKPKREESETITSTRQGLSPYFRCRWFAVQRQTTDPRHLELRKVYPRAYEHWSEEEKTELRRRIQDGDDYDLVAKDLHRQPEAVSVAIWRVSAQLASECGIPKPEKLQMRASGSGLPETPVDLPALAPHPVRHLHEPAPTTIVPTTTMVAEAVPTQAAPQIELPMMPAQVPSAPVNDQATIPAPLPAPIRMMPAPLMAQATEDDHDPTPCPYMEKIFRQIGPRDPNALWYPNDFPPLRPEPALIEEPVFDAPSITRRASPTAVFSMAQSVRRSLKSQGVGTKQITLIADLLRQAQEA